MKWYKSNSEKNIEAVLKYYENKEVPLTVTFSRPIAVEEFESLVSNYSIKVDTFKIRTLDESGTRGTMFGAPDEKELVPQDKVLRMLEFSNSKVQGIVAFTGRILADSKNISKLQTDEIVYIVNMDSILIAKENPSIKKMPVVDDVYWKVEDYIRK